MKRSFVIIAWVIFFAVFLSGCNKDIAVEKPDLGGTLISQVNVNLAAIKSSVETRTYIGTYGDMDNTILWGDKNP